MSNKDLLKLENEFRNELPHYKEKPKIGQMPKSDKLTSRISSFLENAKKVPTKETQESEKTDNCKPKAIVEMDIYLTPSME